MQDLKNEFPALQGQTYLNTASSGLLSRSTYLWRKEHDLDFINNGVDFKFRKQIPEDTRAAVARFFNAQLDEVALVPNFSFGFNIILEGLPKGQKVLMLKNDYPSLLWPVETRDFNVCYAEINEHLEDTISAAFEKYCPDVFVFSLVQWLSGVKIDLSFIKHLKEKYPNVLLMADATQYLGTEQFNFSESGLDVMGGSCYKWMLAGFGNGIMLVKKDAQAKVYPSMIGFNSADTFDSKAEETTFIKHFEPGHQDTFNYGSLHQAILQAEKVSVEKISAKIKDISAYAKGHFIELGLLDKTTKNRKIHSSIFNLKGDMELFKKLAANTIICSPRGGGIRVSFHYYNELEDVDALVHTLSKK
ncbi:aminotransferase class V-fold PLP-dependent enzyme [Patiriisocius sp. Uisw_017]|jgi:selenocysteine lyase/cysteine desulfurase|uniref:aminotransferase class V-fold PLP-dependent enzyme n=1 Tax=Patiriisocius sp. Uisw_017 TaxID=3230968 RepID=UPI0039EA1235